MSITSSGFNRKRIRRRGRGVARVEIRAIRRPLAPLMGDVRRWKDTSLTLHWMEGCQQGPNPHFRTACSRQIKTLQCTTELRSRTLFCCSLSFPLDGFRNVFSSEGPFCQQIYETVEYFTCNVINAINVHIITFQKLLRALISVLHMLSNLRTISQLQN